MVKRGRQSFPQNSSFQAAPPPPPPPLPSSLVANIRPPQPINVHGDRVEEWTLFDQQFTWFAAATSLDAQPENIQIAVFMSSLGAEAVKEFNSLKLTAAELASLSQIRLALQQRFAPKTNYRFERYQFNKLSQDTGEKFDKFLTRVMSRAKKCEFGDKIDDFTVDRIIFGIRDDALRLKLLDIDPLTLFKATMMCRNSETCQTQVKVVIADSQQKCQSTSSVDAIAKPSRPLSEPSSSPGKSYNCRNCGSSHPWRQCPAFGQTCSKCGRRNHSANVCRARSESKANAPAKNLPESRTSLPKQPQKKVAEIQEPQPTDDETSVCTLSTDARYQQLDDVFYVNSVQLSVDQLQTNSDDVWFEELCLPNNQSVRLKLDSGAQCNVLPKSVASKLRASIQPSTVRRIVSFSDGSFQLPVLGEIKVIARFMSRRFTSYQLTFLVVEPEVSPILGLRSCIACGFIRRVLETDARSWSELKNEFSSLFTGLGSVQNFVYDMVLVDQPKLSVCPARRIPFKLHAAVKAELALMEKLQVIVKVDHPTPCVSPMVVIKKGGKIKLGIDPSELNKNLKRHHHPLRTVEEIAAKVAGSKRFTVLDCFKGYWQLPLSKRTQDLLTFATPWGRYSCLRLPYGISSAPEIFQKLMSSLFQDLDNVEVSMDDILIHGANDDELQLLTRTVLKRIEQSGFKLNPQKCVFGVSSVRFLGHIFSEKGLCPDPSKIEGIRLLKNPSSVTELQRFLGSVTYLGKFIPNLSTLTEPLRNLLRKDVVWNWTTDHQNAFNRLKAVISSEPVLKFYDVNLPVVLSVDASSRALGAVLLQEGQPVAYATKALTDSQSYLPQIEKEALAVRFACHKFHQYIAGKELRIESDHKPLESIFRKPIYLAPPRLKRLLLDVVQYNPTVFYKKGKDIPLPDMLSRDCANSTPQPEPELEVLVVLPLSDTAKHTFQQATKSDPELIQLAEQILKGWPETLGQVPQPIKQYFSFRDELSIHDDIILKSECILVPTKLRHSMLVLLHQGHLGTTSCVNRAKTALFWPGMTQAITTFVARCEVCQSSAPKKQSEPLLLRPIPQRPWETVATDIFQLGTNHYLLIADSYSGFVDYKLLTSLNSSAVISAFKYWFSVHGIPDYLDSDGGPQFASSEFESFARDWQFKHRVSSPHYPQSNGLAERNVATVKNLLARCAKDKTDPHLALLNWRNTPRSKELPSPNERLMSRRTKTLLPTPTSLLLPKVVPNVPDKLAAARTLQKTYADRAALPQQPLQPGDVVFVREGDRQWIKGRILAVLPEPRSYRVETQSGQILRRNASFLRRTSLPFTTEPKLRPPDPQPEQHPPLALAGRPRRLIKPPDRLNL